jgi:hypothetical protein
MRVIKCLFVFLAVLALVPAMTLAASAPTKDAVVIGKPEMSAAGTGVTRRVTVPLTLDNTQQLVAMDIPLTFGNPGDGVNLVNVAYADRVSYFDEKITNIDNEKKTLIMGLISMAYDPSKPDLEAGSGPIAYLTFDITDPTIESFTIATTRMSNPSHRLMLVWHEAAADGNLQVRYNDDLDFSMNVPVSSAGAGPVPVSYALDQNYPNPFNAGTVISFSLPERSKVNVSVYNVLGQTVRVLANEEMEAGVRTVNWDGRDENGASAASGVYFYRISANSFKDTKKMTLLK